MNCPLETPPGADQDENRDQDQDDGDDDDEPRRQSGPLEESACELLL